METDYPATIADRTINFSVTPTGHSLEAISEVEAMALEHKTRVSSHQYTAFR